MSADTEKLARFYDNVVGVIAEKNNKNRHAPDASCFAGLCEWCPKERNWRGLLPLVQDFLKLGPGVSRSWKLAATRDGFNSGELHDIMIGVFIGADKSAIGYMGAVHPSTAAFIGVGIEHFRNLPTWDGREPQP